MKFLKFGITKQAQYLLTHRTMSSDKTDFLSVKLYHDVKAHIDAADTSGDLYSEDRSTFELLKRVVEFLGSLDEISDAIVNTNAYPEATRRRRDNNTAAPQGPQQQQQNQEIGKEVLTVLGRVEARLGKLEKGQLAAGKQGPRTYAEAAQQAHRGPPADTEARHHKVVLVKIKDSVEAGHLRRVSCGELKERINHFRNTGARAVLGVRRLPSGDYTLHTSTVAAKNELEQSTEWLASIGKSAEVSRRVYSVLVHGVRTKSIDAEQQQQAIDALTRQNRTLHPGLVIVKVAWPRAAQGKDYSSLVVDTYEPAAANRILDEGIVEGADVKTCEIYHRNLRLRQCYKCQRYGHVATACCDLQCCAHCSGQHDTRQCRVSEDPARARCGACHQRGHKAWDKACTTRDKELNRLTAARMAAPGRFLVPRVETQGDKCLHNSSNSSNSNSDIRANGDNSSGGVDNTPSPPSPPPPPPARAPGEKRPRSSDGDGDTRSSSNTTSSNSNTSNTSNTGGLCNSSS